jgi:tetratricopeptide (TPR) repeat protein
MADSLLWNEIGNLYQKMGAVEDSIRAYLKALEIDPNAPLVCRNLADAYFQKQEYGRAISLYRKCLALFPFAEEQAVVWTKIGDAYRALRDLENAFRAYRKAEQLELNAPPAAETRLPSQESEDPLEAAAPPNRRPAPSEHAERETPPRDRVEGMSTSPAPAQGRSSSSSSRFTDILNSRPPNAETGTPSSRHLSSSARGGEETPLAIDQSALDETLGKISIYEKISRANPANHRVWDTLGKLYKAIGRYGDAIQAYQQAIAAAPHYPHYYYYLGLLFSIQRQDEQAIWAFENVLRLNPDYALAHSALAGIYRRRQMEAKANQHITAALEKMKEESNYNRACFYAICGDIELSIQHLQQALEDKEVSLEWIKADPDLESIRADERYRQLILENETPLASAPENCFAAELPEPRNQVLSLLNNSVAR